MREVRTYNLWILVHRSDEFDGVWRADIPQLDYWAQADSPHDAVDAAHEVASEIILGELNGGREPQLMSPTDMGAEGVAGQIARVLLSGEKVTMEEIIENPERMGLLAVQFRVNCVKREISEPTVLVGQFDAEVAASM